MSVGGFLIRCRHGRQPQSSAADSGTAGSERIEIVQGTQTQRFVVDGRTVLLDGYAIDRTDDELVSALINNDEPVLTTLHGNYCAAIIDTDETIVGLCDRFGARTLYWRTDDTHGTVISSRWEEMPVYDYAWDPQGIAEILRYRYTSGFQSAVKDISQLPLGHRVSFGPSREVALQKTGWSHEMSDSLSGASFDDYKEETKRAIRRSLESISQRHRKAAIYLSGGVDSSLLAAVARDVFDECLLLTPEFAGDSNPELPAAKAYSKALGLEHRLVRIDESRLSADLQRLVRAKGGQINFHLLAMHQLNREIPDDYELALMGEGADALFGCMPFRRTATLMKRKLYADRIPRAFAEMIEHFAHGRLRSFLDLRNLSHEQLSAQHLQIKYSPDSARIIEQITDTDWTDVDPLELFRSYSNLDSNQRTSKRFRVLLQEIGLKTEMASHVREVELSAQLRGTMICCPYLSEPIVDVARRLPDEHYIGARGVKPILKELACEHFDRELIYGTKMGFAVPFLAWLDGPLSEFTEGVRNERALFDGRQLANLDTAGQYPLFWSLINWKVLDNQLARQQQETCQAVGPAPH